MGKYDDVMALVRSWIEQSRGNSQDINVIKQKLSHLADIVNRHDRPWLVLDRIQDLETSTASLNDIEALEERVDELEKRFAWYESPWSGDDKTHPPVQRDDERRYGTALWECNCLDADETGFRIYQWYVTQCDNCFTRRPRLADEPHEPAKGE